MGEKPQSVTGHDWAQFWAVDLHVHTPGSSDAHEADYGTAEDIVQAAIAGGLDGIAITDHNTATWCEQMATAAETASLIVLPGFELSTPEGHLLGIWEEGTKAHVLEDVLIRVGIARAQFGDLNVVTSKSMIDCAKEIEQVGGVAIAAHIDKERGILTQPVQTYVNQLLADPAISAYEYVGASTPEKVAAKLAGKRNPALVQNSDTYDATLSRHSVTAIGSRRTWIKAARPDLCGLRYALDDHELRVTLADPSTVPPHPTIDAVRISDGFLSGVSIRLSPDLNCFLGGTGAGKSLILEATRFALDQQVDGSVFTAIRDEVDGRLAHALREGTEVSIEVNTTTEKYRIRRSFNLRGANPVVEQYVDGDWVEIERDPSTLITIAAFSQGEILEYARQPVGRVGLVDAHLDLSEIDQRSATAEGELRTNAMQLITARNKVAKLSEKASKVATLKERARELSTLFDADLVKAQADWTAENGQLQTLAEQVATLSFTPPQESTKITEKLPEHKDKYERIRKAQDTVAEAVADARKLVENSLDALKSVVSDVQTEFNAEFKAFQVKLDETLAKSGGTSLATLRRELQTIQTELSQAESAATELKDIAQPKLDELETHRETLLDELKQARDERRALRRARANELNKKMAGFVKIDIPTKGDTSKFRSALNDIKTGSRVQDRVLDLIAERLHPYQFARALWTGDLTKVGKLPEGVTAADISRLYTNIADRDLWTQLLELQQIDTPDVLDVKFKKPEGGSHVSIEHLSHGQKCTAILVILLADGDTPVLIDQPEDALHAPWIEDYLVDRLRELRGTRQYIFATRSPGLVVSADSEQLITMRATADKGEVEASGSLERHDLNALALYHLEGGKIPFGRRARKLGSSISS